MRYLVRMRKLSEVPCTPILAAGTSEIRRTGNCKVRYPLHAQLAREEVREDKCLMQAPSQVTFSLGGLLPEPQREDKGIYWNLFI